MSVPAPEDLLTEVQFPRTDGGLPLLVRKVWERADDARPAVGHRPLVRQYSTRALAHRNCMNGPASWQRPMNRSRKVSAIRRGCRKSNWSGCSVTGYTPTGTSRSGVTSSTLAAGSSSTQSSTWPEPTQR